MRTLAHCRYLGDGVYVAYDGYRIVLRRVAGSSQHALTATEIVLEPDVWARLAAWVVALYTTADEEE
jgi:hypothetical protein